MTIEDYHKIKHWSVPEVMQWIEDNNISMEELVRVSSEAFEE